MSSSKSVRMLFIKEEIQLPSPLVTLFMNFLNRYPLLNFKCSSKKNYCRPDLNNDIYVVIFCITDDRGRMDASFVHDPEPVVVRGGR